MVVKRGLEDLLKKVVALTVVKLYLIFRPLKASFYLVIK